MDNNIERLLDGRPLQWLADRTKIHRNTLKPIKSGKTKPRLETADLIAFAFGVTIYDVFPGLLSKPPK